MIWFKFRGRLVSGMQANALATMAACGAVALGWLLTPERHTLREIVHYRPDRKPPAYDGPYTPCVLVREAWTEAGWRGRLQCGAAAGAARGGPGGGGGGIPTLERPGYLIPPGRYRVEINTLRTLGERRAQILNVRGRSGIFVHEGRRQQDSEGCILVPVGAIDDATTMLGNAGWILIL